MKKIPLLIVFLFLFNMIHAQKAPGPEGRWNLTMSKNGRQFPSWLEVVHSGNRTLVGYFVGIGGSARPVSKINIDGQKFSFAIPPQWEEGDQDLKVEGTFSGNTVSGNITEPDGKTYPYTGERAPALKARTNVQWGKPVPLFNGKDLTGWTALGRTNQWVATGGVLQSPKSGANIRTDKTFKDFKLHIEFRYPKGSNSGIYLRGRYEVQVSDNAGAEPTKGDYGAIYGFILPGEMAAKPAGEWQSMDITLIGRTVTVVANGKTIISNQVIPGPTGGAIDSKEGEPGPIMLQGDHGAVEYRNITIAEAVN
jgi:3-keto-disaccharide hydrolase